MNVFKKGAKALVIAAAVTSLGACTTTNTDEFNVCAMGYTLAGLGIGLASSGTGVVIAGAAGGAGIGYLACDEEVPMPEEPEIVAAAAAPAPEPVGDQDGDGIRDDRDDCPNTPEGVEVDYKGCPKPLVFNGNYLAFEFDSAELPANADEGLENALAYMSRYPDGQYEVAGHTDGIGSDAYNQNLSERRAQAVADYLVANKGVAADQITVVGYGESMPVASNETDSGRARNRRVQVKLLD